MYISLLHIIGRSIVEGMFSWSNSVYLYISTYTTPIDLPRLFLVFFFDIYLTC